MKLKFIGYIPDDKSFQVTVNGQSKSLDVINKEVVFELSEVRNYKITITQEKSFNNHTFVMILLFILTSIIQGLINVFMLNTD